MGAESPVNAAYGAIDRYGLDDELSALKSLLKRSIAQRNRSETHPAEAADEVPHDLVPDVAEMLRDLSAPLTRSAPSRRAGRTASARSSPTTAWPTCSRPWPAPRRRRA